MVKPDAAKLIEGIDAGCLIVDKGYDSDEIVKLAIEFGMEAVIPPRKNQKEQREYDKYLYRFRHLVENAIMYLKQWRGIATRYAKNTALFLAAVHIRCIVIWAKISGSTNNYVNASACKGMHVSFFTL